jgi:hypothetical protein
MPHSEAVIAAYGWKSELSNEEILERNRGEYTVVIFRMQD